jgi:hypothetical protein
MREWFISLGPVTQAFLATSFTWFVTALGAAMDRAWANLPTNYQWLKDWEYV